MDLASRFIAFSTILHLVIVTFERYVMIIHPMHYRKIISKQTTVASLILIWIFSLSVSLIQLFWISLDSTQTLTHERRIDAIYSYCCFVFLVVLPVILLAIVYVRIFLVLRSQLKKIHRQLSHITRGRRVRQKRGKKRAVIFWLNDPCLYLRLVFVLSKWNFLWRECCDPRSADCQYDSSPYEVRHLSC